MTDHSLAKGANISLLQRSDVAGGRLQAVVRWADLGGAADIDVSALLLGADGRVRSDDDFVFYNAPAGGDGSVRLLGKRADDEAGEDRVSVDLESLPAGIERVVIAASLDVGDGSGFGDVGGLGLILLDSTGRTTARFDVESAGPETAMVLGEVYLRHEEWKFRAVGQGWESGLAGLATDYGITVDDSPADGGPADGGPAGSALTEDDPADGPAGGFDPADTAGADLVELPAPAGSPDDTALLDTGAGTPVDDPGTAVGRVPTGDPTDPPVPAPPAPRAARRTGVPTQKKRTTAAMLPPLTLAESPSWQPARLFSISGVGSAVEQEKRATSTLLSTMTAVRGFGRALVSRFGGPAGTVETYLEVPFTLGERVSRPDGVIRVSRGGRIWTALLETKTGGNTLRHEQVDRYVDLARQQGYDAVITLSNELSPMAGMAPVSIDGRKLRTVALHHISWSEVLHEAQMQLAHHGVEDRLQAWMLAELVRYLTHPSSGAAGFADMGPSWVQVRDAARASTLRAGDRKIGAVTTSWEKLVRHLGLRLTSQLGVTVSPVLPRRLATDHAARARAAAEDLATYGTLTATLRIPGAAGPVRVRADLRTAQVRTSVDVDAPEGGNTRRVSWLLRQLADAPAGLTVEVSSGRRDGGVCEPLGTARKKPAALLPDAGDEIRSFRITATTPLGLKRSGVAKAFIPSVNNAVDDFYARVVQALRPGLPRLQAEAAPVEAQEEV